MVTYDQFVSEIEGTIGDLEDLVSRIDSDISSGNRDEEFLDIFPDAVGMVNQFASDDDDLVVLAKRADEIKSSIIVMWSQYKGVLSDISRVIGEKISVMNDQIENVDYDSFDQKEASMLGRLFKLAYHLDGRGLYDEAKKIEEVMKQLAQRVGLQMDEMVSLADHFDGIGDFAMADYFDNMISEAKKKKPGPKNKKDKGAAHQPPGPWFKKMKKEIKKGNPDYSEERVAQTIGEIWYNRLSDEKRSEIYKRHGKKKSPNKS